MAGRVDIVATPVVDLVARRAQRVALPQVLLLAELLLVLTQAPAALVVEAVQVLPPPAAVPVEPVAAHPVVKGP